MIKVYTGLYIKEVMRKKNVGLINDPITWDEVDPFNYISNPLDIYEKLPSIPPDTIPDPVDIDL